MVINPKLKISLLLFKPDVVPFLKATITFQVIFHSKRNSHNVFISILGKVVLARLPRMGGSAHPPPEE